MALGPSILHAVSKLRRDGRLANGAHVIEIGTQQLSNAFLRSRQLLEPLYEEFGRPLTELGMPPPYSGRTLEVLPETAPMAETFWRALGFSYSAIDYIGGEHTCAVDLNRDDAPPSMRGAADLVVNCGTTEHVANQDNAMRVIHDLTKPGGIMFHDLPSSGLLTHGLVGYNPYFFWCLCRENNYCVEHLSVRDGGKAPISSDVFGSNKAYKFGYPCPDLPAEIQLFSIVAVLRKDSNANYITPLDVPR